MLFFAVTNQADTIMVYEGYYCPKCKNFVTTEIVIFNHPEVGPSPCRVCKKCKTMVFFKRGGSLKEVG